jgi:hypothetical protein
MVLCSSCSKKHGHSRGMLLNPSFNLNRWTQPCGLAACCATRRPSSCWHTTLAARAAGVWQRSSEEGAGQGRHQAVRAQGQGGSATQQPWVAIIDWMLHAVWCSNHLHELPTAMLCCLYAIQQSVASAGCCVQAEAAAWTCQEAAAASQQPAPADAQAQALVQQYKQWVEQQGSAAPPPPSASGSWQTRQPPVRYFFYTSLCSGCCCCAC